MFGKIGEYSLRLFGHVKSRGTWCGDDESAY